VRKHLINIFLFLFLTLFSNIVLCQDSLYLIGTITGKSTTEQIIGVKGVGDINGDGYDDFMVSVGYHSIQLYLGSPNFNLTPSVVFHYPGKEAPNSLGNMAGIGDVNGDGYNDFLLGGNYDNGAGGKGKVFLYYGGKHIDTIPVMEFSEPWIEDGFGSTLQGIGDINKDGYDDFIISSPYNWSDGKGRVYLFYGGDTISFARSKTFVDPLTIGTLNDSFFGQGVANIGDINRDGYDDIAISAGYHASEMSEKVYIYYGRNPMDTIPDTVLTSNNLYYGYGETIQNAGDLNKDGINDFCIGSAGWIFIYNGINRFNNPLVLQGITLCTGGDINHDGYNDFIIGNSEYINSDSVMVGGAFVYLGGDKIDTVYKYKLEGENKWDEFSKTMTTGDINGDGYSELFVLAPSYPDYNNPLGKVYIYSFKKPTDVKENKGLSPYKFDLYQNFPNPFNPNTVIKYQLPSVGTQYIVSLRVYDILGREVRTLVNELQRAGTHTITFNASGLSSGIYFYRLSTNHSILQRTMVLIK
jgi:Secretion system C-terminal sorting domain/FG-GAP-like repeat/FG-GAP repeat